MVLKVVREIYGECKYRRQLLFLIFGCMYVWFFNSPQYFLFKVSHDYMINYSTGNHCWLYISCTPNGSSLGGSLYQWGRKPWSEWSWNLSCTRSRKGCERTEGFYFSFCFEVNCSYRYMFLLSHDICIDAVLIYL